MSKETKWVINPQPELLVNVDSGLPLQRPQVMRDEEDRPVRDEHGRPQTVMVDSEPIGLGEALRLHVFDEKIVEGKDTIDWEGPRKRAQIRRRVEDAFEGVPALTPVPIRKDDWLAVRDFIDHPGWKLPSAHNKLLRLFDAWDDATDEEPARKANGVQDTDEPAEGHPLLAR